MISSETRKPLLLAASALIAIPASLAIVHSPLDVVGNAWLSFFALLVAFAIAAVFAVRFEISNLTSWLTFMILLQFGIAPIACAFLGLDQIDTFSVRALAYIFIGTVGFWAGAKIVSRTEPINRFIPADSSSQFRRLSIGLTMFALGTCCKFYMLRQGLFSYIADSQKVEDSSSFIQWLLLLAGLTIYSQITVTIEYFQSNPIPLVKHAFILVTVVNLIFALISGMKGEILVIPVLILLIGRLVTRKLQWRMAGFVLLLFFVIVPLNLLYRDEVRMVGSITSLQSGNDAAVAAVSTLSQNAVSDFAGSAIERASDRLNLLQVIVFLDRHQDLINIEGDERLWMMPFYPFVPRFLWKDKPVLDKGRRLNLALYSSSDSSTAVTPFGDLLLMAGVPAIFLGMIFVGAAIQAITNLTSGEFGAKALFIYIVLFSKFYALEYDIMMLGTTMIQTSCVAMFAAYLIYNNHSLGNRLAGRPVQ